MRDYSQKINKAMRAKALFCALSEKVREGQVYFVDALAFEAPKTKDASAVLAQLSKVGAKDMATRTKNAVLVAVSGDMGNVLKSFRNMGNVEVVKTSDLNPVKVLKYKYVLMTEPEKGSSALEARISK
jgi:large subunit ribosomal protein L4